MFIAISSYKEKPTGRDRNIIGMSGMLQKRRKNDLGIFTSNKKEMRKLIDDYVNIINIIQV